MDNREANFVGHPPYCTCVDCTKKRLEKLKGLEIPRLQKCPQCKRTSLFWDGNAALFECLNLECKKRFTLDDLSREAAEPTESETLHDEQTHEALKQPESMGASSGDTSREARQELPSSGRAWFGNEYFDPEDGRWKKAERRASPLRKVLLAFLILILVAGASVYAYLELTSSGGVHAPSAFTATEGNMQITLSWNKENSADQVLVRCKTTSYPSSITDGTLLYEGNVTSYLHKNLEYGKTYYYGIWSERVVDGQRKYSDKGAFASGTPYWRGPNGEEIQENVYFEGAETVGADGHSIKLVNNPDAANPSWSQLVSFLSNDQTDKIPYNDNTFVCGDFAETLHNNAEKAGIRAADVTVDLGNALHSCNAFQTTDRGLVYIDDTGTEEGTLNADKIVKIVLGQQYTPVSIFPNPGYEDTWGSMGTVADTSIQW